MDAELWAEAVCEIFKNKKALGQGKYDECIQ